MLNQIECKSAESVNAIVLGIEIDRILIFVETKAEIEAFRQSNFYYFEFINRNLEQGTVSNIFFLENLALELIWIEDQELASRYSSQVEMNIVARTQWQQNQAIPFGFVLRYISNQQQQSRRRCHNSEKDKINSSNISSQISFSHQNLQELREPACYMVPESLTCRNLLDNTSVIKQKLLFYQSSRGKLTNIQVTLNNSKPLSNTVALLSTLNLIKIKQGNCPKLNLEFDNGCNQQHSALFPTIPLTISH